MPAMVARVVIHQCLYTPRLVTSWPRAFGNDERTAALVTRASPFVVTEERCSRAIPSTVELRTDPQRRLDRDWVGDVVRVANEQPRQHAARLGAFEHHEHAPSAAWQARAREPTASTRAASDIRPDHAPTSVHIRRERRWATTVDQRRKGPRRWGRNRAAWRRRRVEGNVLSDESIVHVLNARRVERRVEDLQHKSDSNPQ